MTYWPSEFVAEVLCAEISDYRDNVNGTSIDTENNTITFYGAIGPETMQLPKGMELIVDQHQHHIIVKNSPKHKEAHYFMSRRFQIGKTIEK